MRIGGGRRQMYEEIRELVDILKETPQYVIWILAGFMAYKMFILGSIYGLIRLAIIKVHDWLVKPKHELVALEYKDQIRGLLISTSEKPAADTLRRIKSRKGRMSSTDYLHDDDLQWLEAAIDEKLIKEQTS